MSEEIFTLSIHTCDFDGDQPDEAVGHDWTIWRNTPIKYPVFFEGHDKLNLGEARELVRLMNLAGDCFDWPRGVKAVIEGEKEREKDESPKRELP